MKPQANFIRTDNAKFGKIKNEKKYHFETIAVIKKKLKNLRKKLMGKRSRKEKERARNT